MELLAPAGDMSALRGAVQNGADAVYLGASRFSARANAGNFEDTQLKNAVEYCHVRGTKVYLAINTLIKDSELSDAFNQCRYAANIGVDALIVQDLGLASTIKEARLPIRLHASTQMTANCENSVKFLAQRGFSRVVLARECSKSTLQKIGKLARELGIELEVFCHGALCVSYSGQCLLSSFLGGRSANRGMCAQPCRLPYKCGNKSGYFLSPKDLSLLSEIHALEDMGITSLKIEGRMKGAAYVAAVTGVYKKYIENNIDVAEEDAELLKAVFSRGGSFTKGLYAGIRGRDMMNTKAGNDDIYRGQNKELIKRLEAVADEGVEQRKISVSGAVFSDEQRLYFTLSDGENCAVASVAYDAARDERLSLSDEYARRQLSKLGATPYTLTDFSFSVSGSVFVPASSLNGLRREAVEKLTQMRIGTHDVSTAEMPNAPEEKVQSRSFFVAASVQTAQQAEALRSLGAEHIYAPYPLCDKIGAEYAILPPAEKLPKDLKTKKVLAGYIGAYEYAAEKNLTVALDISMNIFNKYAANSLCAEFVSVSPELSLSELSVISKYAPCQAVAYGHMPLMRTGNCMIRTVGRCDKLNCKECKKEMVLTDRKGENMRVVSNGQVNIIYNAHPIFMADKLDALKKCGLMSIRLMFTNETPDECAEIYKMYTGMLPPTLPKRFTRGHFIKGI